MPMSDFRKRVFAHLLRVEIAIANADRGISVHSGDRLYLSRAGDRLYLSRVCSSRCQHKPVVDSNVL